MRNRSFLLLMCGLAGLCQGCGTFYNVARTTLLEPALYWDDGESFVSKVRFYNLAEKAWDLYVSQAATAAGDGFLLPSTDFAAGFKKGFASYLYAGGTGAPPPLPPRCYWKSRYQNPQGQIAVRDWFEGYRIGVCMAKDSGLREAMILAPSASIHVAPDHSAPHHPPAPILEGPPPKAVPDLKEVPPKIDLSRQKPAQVFPQKLPSVTNVRRDNNKTPHVIFEEAPPRPERLGMPARSDEDPPAPDIRNWESLPPVRD